MQFGAWRRRAAVLLPSPDLFEPSLAATGSAVELVAHRVSQVEVLVIILGRIELGCRDDFGHDGLFEAALQGLLGFFRQPLLRLILIEDGGAILAAEVAEL